MNKLVLFLLLMLALFTMSPDDAGARVDREWRFQVSLDGKEVGSQNFNVQQLDGTTRLETEADLAVKLLFVTVYRYKHRNVETWDGQCLTGIETSTRVNGKTQAVSGTQRNGFFEVTGSGDTTRLPECVMTFAYWNPEFLNQSKLLNSQNGEYVDVDISGPEADELIVRGEPQAAQRYRLVAGDIDMQLWYSLNDEWLALESKTEGGRTLQYKLL